MTTATSSGDGIGGVERRRLQAQRKIDILAGDGEQRRLAGRVEQAEFLEAETAVAAAVAAVGQRHAVSVCR